MSASDRPTPACSPTTSIGIEGPLVIGTVADWHRKLQEATRGNATLAVDLGAVTEIDVFGLQLLLATLRTCAGRGQLIELPSRSAVFDHACASAGFSPSLFLAP